MQDAAQQLYNSLTSYEDLESLIASAEAENLYLECKAPSEPRLSREQKAKLSQALSGFSNAAGGVIIWGISTTKHAQSGLDILTQLEPIGHLSLFANHIKKAIPTSCRPSIINTQTKTIKKSPSDTKGIAVTYIPKNEGDPIQANDNLFYFRSGDEFIAAPYEIIKRLFAATESPDLHVVFDGRIVTQRSDGKWLLPIPIENRTSAAAEHVAVFAEIENPDACEKIESELFNDVSNINPGKKIYEVKVNGVIHRGINVVAGTLIFKMKVSKRAKRNIRVKISLYANKMRARVQSATLRLAKKGFSLQSSKEMYIY